MAMSLKVNMNSKWTFLTFTFLIHDPNLTANDSSVIPKTKRTLCLYVLYKACTFFGRSSCLMLHSQGTGPSLCSWTVITWHRPHWMVSNCSVSVDTVRDGIVTSAHKRTCTWGPLVTCQSHRSEWLSDILIHQVVISYNVAHKQQRVPSNMYILYKQCKLGIIKSLIIHWQNAVVLNFSDLKLFYCKLYKSTLVEFNMNFKMSQFSYIC